MDEFSEETRVLSRDAGAGIRDGNGDVGGYAAPRETRAGASPYTAHLGSPDTHIGATQPMPVRKGLFDGISIAQIIAASAAAATSMLLASRIGIAGSVIGAAVSSMVTVVCSQLYRNALDASARKLKAKQILATPERGAAADPMHGEIWNAGGNPSPRGVGAGSTDGNHLTARIAPTKLQARAAAERVATKRKVALASAAIAIVAVLACATAIMLGTSGEGLGAKAPSLLPTSAPSGEPANNSTDELAPADDAQEAPNGQTTTSDGATSGSTASKGTGDGSASPGQGVSGENGSATGNATDEGTGDDSPSNSDAGMSGDGSTGNDFAGSGEAGVEAGDGANGDASHTTPDVTMVS